MNDGWRMKITSSLGLCQVKPMGKKAKCMADGGIVGADGMTDAQRAKRNAVLQSLGMSTAQPTVQSPPAMPQTVQVTTPAEPDRPRGIMGILGNRGKQIDKAAGYARGGIVRGKGGIDNVPMSVGGVNVNLTGGKKPEAVLPGKTVEALGGPDAVEALIEATNGKPPVKDGLKAGGRYANGLVIEEDDPRLKPFGQTAPTLGSGLSGMGRPVASTGVPAPATFSNGRDATGTITADSAQSMAAAPMQRSGGIAGSIDMAGVNGVLARENKARGEMIDAMAAANGGNGVSVLDSQATLPGGMSVSDWNATVGMDNGSKAAYMLAKQRNDALVAQQGITARGQDMDFQRAAAHDKVAMRGQDISGANEAIRAGVDRERLGIAQADSRRADQRFGIEKGILEGSAADQKAVRDARTALTAALASGDPKAIEAAKANAIAAGIKFDGPKNEYSFNANPMTGELTVGNKDTGAATVWQKGKKVVDIAAHGTQPSPMAEYQAAISAAQGNKSKIDAINERARKNGVIQ